MKVKLGDGLFLNSDAYCYWITEKRISKETKRERETRVSGYCVTLERCFASYLERRVRGTETTTMAAWKREMNKLKKELKEMIECLASEELKNTKKSQVKR